LFAALALVVATTTGLHGHHDAASPVRFAAATLEPPAALPHTDSPVPASRSTIRSSGPHLLPGRVGKNPECLLTLPAGVWALDVTAARTLTMLSASAYRDNRPVEKAARAFEHEMNRRPQRFVPSAYGARRLLGRTYRHPIPHTWAVDAVLALYDKQTLTCITPIRPAPWEDMLTNGLTPRAQTMVFAFFAAYGGRAMGGFELGGIITGHIENSAHYEGRAVDVSFPTADPDNNRRGWLLAHWLVAQADYLQIATVIFDDRVWTRSRSAEGWRPYVHPSGNTTDPTLRHLDHIHVDVVHGYCRGAARMTRTAGPCPESRNANVPALVALGALPSPTGAPPSDPGRHN